MRGGVGEGEPLRRRGALSVWKNAKPQAELPALAAVDHDGPAARMRRTSPPSIAM
jgi:hypothetical protein